MSKIIFFTDGGSRGNPGPSAYGFVIKKNGVNLHEEGRTLGIATNNVAEYTAVLSALQWLKTNRDKIGNPNIIYGFMDSLLVCQQLKGLYKIKKAHLQTIMDKIRETENELNVKIIYSHVPREENKEADKMVNIALDSTS